MSTNFYTSAHVQSGKILFRGVIDGKRVARRLDYRPSLFVSSPEGEFESIKGQKFGKVDFSTISEAKKFISDYSSTSNFPVHGMRRFEYPFIDSYFPGEINYDITKILIGRIDIEVMSDNGFPEPERASDEVTAITLKLNDEIHVFALKEFDNSKANVIYHQCVNEADLLRSFLSLWTKDYPDIVTGWNIQRFDIPYLVNRILKVLGEDFRKKMSPWGTIRETTSNFRGFTNKAYELVGIAILDSMELYQKYSPKGMSQDSYALDNIGEVELKEKKLDYSAYGDLNGLYRQNFQLYIEYNIQDVLLDEKIANKYDVIRLALAVAYMNKVNYEDIFKQVRMWAAIVDRVLLSRKIVINHGFEPNKIAYSGGFVKEPNPGRFDWIVNFDLNSLYPHLIMQYNISPETLVEPYEYTDGMNQLLAQSISVEALLNKQVDTSLCKTENVTLTPNRQLFRRDKRGFLPEIMEKMYNDRVKYKKMQIQKSKEAEKATNEKDKLALKDESAKYKSLQEALKVCLNSAYGAFGSEYFVLNDVRQAEAITTGGQLAIQWVGNDANLYLQGVTKTKDDFVLAQDTDSMYLVLDQLVKKVFADKLPDTNKVIDFLDKVCNDALQPMIDKSFGELKEYTNSFEQKMVMKRENLANMGVWTGKKRYFLSVYDSEGVRYKKPEIKVTGLESVRSSVPLSARKAMKKCYKFIADNDQKKLHKFVARIKRAWRKADLKKIAFPSGVNGLDKYADSNAIWSKGTPEHVRASLIYNHHIRSRDLENKYQLIRNGNKIRYVYLQEPNPLGTDVIAWDAAASLPTEFDIHGFIDHDACFEKAFGKPMSALLGTFGWETKKTQSLADFFV